MKEIKEIRTIEEVVGYEAFDGTKFVDKTECEKYEKMTAEEAIKKNFAKLVVAMAEEDDDINYLLSNFDFISICHHIQKF